MSALATWCNANRTAPATPAWIKKLSIASTLIQSVVWMFLLVNISEIDWKLRKHWVLVFNCFPGLVLIHWSKDDRFPEILCKLLERTFLRFHVMHSVIWGLVTTIYRKCFDQCIETENNGPDFTQIIMPTESVSIPDVARRRGHYWLEPPKGRHRCDIAISEAISQSSP